MLKRYIIHTYVLLQHVQLSLYKPSENIILSGLTCLGAEVAGGSM